MDYSLQDIDTVFIEGTFDLLQRRLDFTHLWHFFEYNYAAASQTYSEASLNPHKSVITA